MHLDEAISMNAEVSRMKPEHLFGIAVSDEHESLATRRKPDSSLRRPLVLSRQERRVRASIRSGDPVGPVDRLERKRPIPIGIDVVEGAVDATADPVEENGIGDCHPTINKLLTVVMHRNVFGTVNLRHRSKPCVHRLSFP